MCHLGMLYAQMPYYGTPFYKEGFDREDISWAQSVNAVNLDGASTTVEPVWSAILENPNVSPAGARFVAVDPQSTHSLRLLLPKELDINTKIVSQKISAGSKTNLCVGFSAYRVIASTLEWIEFPVAAPSDFFRCEVSTDSIIWDTLWESNKTPKYPYILQQPGNFNGWTTFQTFLPATYNNKDLYIRFSVNIEARNATSTLYVDGVFVSEQRKNDANLLSVNNFDPKAATNLGPYLKVPLTVQFKNEGANDINSIDLGFSRKNDRTKIIETYTPASPVKFGETVTYTLKQPVDLSALNTTDSLYVWIALNNDEYTSNDMLKFNMTNTATTPPYKANFGVLDYWDFLQEGKGNTSAYTYWTSEILAGDSVYKVNQPSKMNDVNSYAFSRPVFLKKDLTYVFSYSAFVSDSTKCIVPLDVYITDHFDTLHLGQKINSFDNVKLTNAKDQLYTFTAAKDTIYYMAFHTEFPSSTGPVLYLSKFSVKQTAPIDAEIMSLEAPVNKAVKYGDAEAVTVKIRNAGTVAIAANTLKVYYQLGNGRKYYETVAEAIEPGESIDYTFATTVNMIGVISYNFTCGVELEGDIVEYNDILKTKITPLLTTIPYNAALIVSGSKTGEENYWTLENMGMSTSGTYSFQYQGTTNKPNTQPGKLYSRPLRMSAGEEYTLTMTMNAMGNANIPFSIGIYEKSEGMFSIVEEVRDTTFNVTTYVRSAVTLYNKEQIKFTSATSGDYYIGFIIAPEDEIKFNINVLDISVTTPAVYDVSVHLSTPNKYRSLCGETYVAGYVQKPKGMTIKDMPVYGHIGGEEYVQYISMADTLTNTLFVFEETFDASVLEKDKDVAVSVSCYYPNDIDLSNNSATTTLSPTETIRGYGNANSGRAAEFSTGERSTGSLDYFQLNDGRVWAAWYQTGPTLMSYINMNRFSLYAQLFDRTGQPVFKGQGLLVSKNNDRSYCVVNSKAIDKQDNLILAYTDLSNVSEIDKDVAGEAHLNKITPEGEFVFGKNGVVISPKSTKLPTVGGIVTDSKGDIYLTLNGISKYDGKTGDLIKQISQGVNSWFVDDQDNIYVAYTDGASLKLQKYNTDLVPQLSIIPVINEEIGANGSIMYKENNGGLWILFKQLNNSINQDDYFVQYLDDNYEPGCGLNGVKISATRTRTTANAWGVPTPDGMFAVAFVENTYGGEQVKQFLTIQKFTKNGEYQFNNNGTGQGKDLIPSIVGSDVIKINGVTYNPEKENLCINYSAWPGTGGKTVLNSYVMFTDIDFEKRTLDVANPVSYAKGDASILGNKSRYDSYGICFAWRSGGDGEGNFIRGQHVYYDGTLAVRSTDINVKTSDVVAGYATGGGLLNVGDEAIATANPFKGYQFKQWVDENDMLVSTENPYKFYITGTVHLFAQFEEKPQNINVLEHDSKLVSVYPNPATEYILFTNSFAGEVTIYSVSGQVVANKSVAAGENMSVKNLVKGVYIVEMKNANVNVRQTIVVK